MFNVFYLMRISKIIQPDPSVGDKLSPTQFACKGNAFFGNMQIKSDNFNQNLIPSYFSANELSQSLPANYGKKTAKGRQKDGKKTVTNPKTSMRLT